MPPKESAKAKKAREKAEKFAAMQFGERQELELEEEKARQYTELQERLGRTEELLDFYETLANPAARLMVPQTTFERLRSKMQREGAISAERVLAMQVELRRMEKSRSVLNHELAHLRSEVRNMSIKVNASLAATAQHVDATLDDFVASLEASIERRRTDTAECAQHLNKALEASRFKHIALARDTQEQAHRITALWQSSTSMHTRIPPRICRTLEALDKDALLLVLHTLSFEDVALKYLLYRFSPGPDDPFAGEGVSGHATPPPQALAAAEQPAGVAAAAAEPAEPAATEAGLVGKMRRSIPSTGADAPA